MVANNYRTPDRPHGMHGQSENVSVEEKPNTILVKQVIPLLF